MELQTFIIAYMEKALSISPNFTCRHFVFIATIATDVAEVFWEVKESS
jgi:hypothetical protein